MCSIKSETKRPKYKNGDDIQYDSQKNETKPTNRDNHNAKIIEI